MTKGSCQGTIVKGESDVQNAWGLDGRRMSRSVPKVVVLAVLMALGSQSVQAAEEVWPDAQFQPTARPVQAAGPLAPDAAVQGASANTEEPTPPGEGPANEIDSVTIGEGSGVVDSFWKPKIHAGVTTSVVLDDNIFITNRNQVSDTVFVVSARATVAFGNVQQWASRFIDTTSRALAAEDEEGSENLIALTYSPTANYFADNNQLDSVDHDAAGTLRWDFGKLKTALDARYQTLSDPDEDLGQRAERQLTRVNLVLTYDTSDKTRLQFDGGFYDRNYESNNGSIQVEGNAYLLYDALPKTTVGLGFGGGQLEYDLDGRETFERLIGRLRYNSYAKLTFNLVGGVEFRQSDFGEDQLNGIFQAGFGYIASEETDFYLSLFRRIEPSANNQSQSIQRTGFSLNYNQRLFQKLTLGTTFNYIFADYDAPDDSINLGRSDNLFSLSATLTFEVTANGFVRLGYIYRQNDSSREVVSYEANQFIFSGTVLF